MDRRRYETDANFRQVTDTLVYALESGLLTQRDIAEAVSTAAQVWAERSGFKCIVIVKETQDD